MSSPHDPSSSPNHNHSMSGHHHPAQPEPLFYVHPMTEEEAQDICTWKYEPPYQLYGFLPWEQMKALGIEMGDSDIRRKQYVSVKNRNEELIGFAQYFPLVGVTRIGLGMRPDLLGHGKGAAFVQAIVSDAARRHPEDEIDLEVLTWNHRAIRAYQTAGFLITDTYERPTPEGMGEFHCMVYQPEANPAE